MTPIPRANVREAGHETFICSRLSTLLQLDDFRTPLEQIFAGLAVLGALLERWTSSLERGPGHRELASSLRHGASGSWWAQRSSDELRRVS